MKKKLVFIGIILLSIFIMMPLIRESLVRKTLNNKTRAQLNGQFIELSDGITHYEIKGKENEKLVVLIHGNALPQFSWDNTIDDLVGAGYQVLRYDVFGHGFSDRPKLKKYNRDLYNRQLEELLDKLSIETPIYLVGTSQGGSISTFFAAKHESQVKKLALLSPFFDSYVASDKLEKLKKPIIGEYIIYKTDDKHFTNPLIHFTTKKKQDKLVNQLKEQISFRGKKRAILANLRGNGLADGTQYYSELAKQKTPIMLTWGDKDVANTKETMERLQKLIPRIQFHEIGNAGHLAHYEFPEKINPLLINFFND